MNKIVKDITKSFLLLLIIDIVYLSSMSKHYGVLVNNIQGSPLKLKFLPKNELTPERGTLSTKKARELLDYNPSFNLEKGYSKYIDWYLKFFENFKKQNVI